MEQAAAAAIARALEELGRNDLLRTRRVLDSPQGAVVREGGQELANFAANDYLGLANHPRLRAAAHAAIDAWGFGAGASPIVVGHTRAHEEAERAFAHFTHAPRALLFPSGYAANLGILTALADRSTAIFADKLNHACLNDGALLSRAAFRRYPHGDFGALEALLNASTAATRVIATDTVFSMDGDIAPLAELAGLAERHDAWLVLDDAHGIGVLGRRTRRARPVRPALPAHHPHGHARQGSRGLWRLRGRRPRTHRVADAARAHLRVLHRPASGDRGRRDRVPAPHRGASRAGGHPARAHRRIPARLCPARHRDRVHHGDPADHRRRSGAAHWRFPRGCANSGNSFRRSARRRCRTGVHACACRYRPRIPARRSSTSPPPCTRSSAMALHVERHGSGPDLVLLHGWGLHGGVWSALAARLATSFRVHVVDLPGHGGSRDALLAGLDGLVDAVAEVTPVGARVCGWSLGGLAALRLAARHPAQVAALALVSTTPCFVRRDDWPHAMAPETLADFALGAAHRSGTHHPQVRQPQRAGRAAGARADARTGRAPSRPCRAVPGCPGRGPGHPARHRPAGRGRRNRHSGAGDPRRARRAGSRRRGPLAGAGPGECAIRRNRGCRAPALREPCRSRRRGTGAAAWMRPCCR